MSRYYFLFLVICSILICGLIAENSFANSNTTFSNKEILTEDECKTGLEVIHSYFNDLNENQWAKIHKWFVHGEANMLKSFLYDKENQQNKLGLLNIRKAQLEDWKSIPYHYAENYVPSKSIEQYRDRKVFYVAVDYQVYKENEFMINGVNYFFIVLVLEDHKWRIASTPIVPVKSIIFDGYGFGTEDEKTFDEIRMKFLTE